MRKFYTLAGILSVSEDEKESIRQQALEGDPVACYKLAEIYMAEGKIVESQQWYEKAVAGGETSAYADLAVARGINDDYTFRDYEAYNDT